MANISWKTGVSGDFAVGSNWSTGTVPGTADTAEIEASGTYTVTSSVSETVSLLILEGDATLDVTGGVFKANAVRPSVTIGAGATLSIGDGATFDWAAKSGNRAYTFAGTIDVAAGGELSLPEAATFTGGGLITLEGAGSQLMPGLSGGDTLDATVQGAGTISSPIGFETFSDDLDTLDADVSSEQVVLAPTIFGLNATLFEATSGGQIIEGSQSGSFMNSQDGTVLVTGVGSQVQVDNASLSADQGTVTDNGEIVLSNNGTLGIDSLTVSSGGKVDLESGTGLGGGVTAAAGGIVQFDNIVSSLTTLDSTGGAVIEVVGGVNSFDQLVNLGTLVADDSVTLQMQDNLVNSGVISLRSAGDDTAITVQTLFDVGFGKTNADHIFTLSGAGVIAMSDNVDNLINAQSAGDILANDGNTISGAGQIGGGSAMGIDNDGVIDATGTNALVVNVATGKVTNQAHGVLEGSGAGGLSLSRGTFTDSGVVAALDGGSVTFGAGATLSNNSSGVLTGGVWEATDAGDGATIDLNGAAITTDAAKIILSGVGSVLETGSTALEASLTTIAAKGRLELLAGRGWTSGVALDDAGFLQLGGGDFDAAGLTVGSGGEVTGFGSIAAPLANAGVVQAYRGDLVLSGSITGSGTLKVFGSSTLEIGGSLASSQGVAFATGVHAVLKLDDPSAFASTIADLGLGDTIDLVSTDATGAQISGDTLAITLQGGGTLNYSLADPGSNVQIVLASDGSGGTDLTLYKETAKSVAKMSERMAGMAGSGGTALPARIAAASAGLAALARPGVG